MADPILKVRDLKKSFGGLMALYGISFELFPQQIKGLMGPNGAGKSTLIKVITDIYPFDKGGGEAFFKGKPLSGLKSFQLAHLGIAQTFQIVQLFGNMTVVENVMIGRHRKTRGGLLTDMLGLRKTRNQEKRIYQEAMEQLSFVGLEAQAFDMAKNLPYGDQRKLEISRALASEPELLFLDEPAAGMNAREKREMAQIINKIRDSGVTILIVDHNMDLLMDISDDLLVLDFGQKIAEDKPENIKKNELVIKAYLGEEYS